MEWTKKLWFLDKDGFPQKYTFIGAYPVPHQSNYAAYMGGPGKLPIRVYYNSALDRYEHDKMGNALLTKFDAINRAINVHKGKLANLEAWKAKSKDE